MKTAIVHDWFYSLSGAEKVVEQIYSIFPSPVYTLIKNKKNLKNLSIPDDQIHTSFIQNLPFSQTKYPYYLPFFPLAIEQFNLSEANLILSSSSCVAKNILTHTGQLHICYCHTPMRYIWDLYFEYLALHKLNKGLKSCLIKIIFHHLRNWDLLHSLRVDHFIANSKHVAKRIEKLYRKESKVIYPPVNTSFFQEEVSKKENIYVTAARLVPYKKVDLIIQAFSQMKHASLIVIGDGPQMNFLKSIATSNITFTGSVDDLTLRILLQQAKAFIYMAYEDFGIFPVEAQAAGTPVIAYKHGGCLETILPNKTGIFFDEQSPSSLIQALKDFEKKENQFDINTIKIHANAFSKERFLKEFKDTVTDLYSQFSQKRW